MPPTSKESFSAPEIPQFSSPEEEIAFLRGHIAEREKQLKENGVETTKEDIAFSTIKEYKTIPEEVIIPKERVIPKAEQDAIVLRLRPETHDKTMEELLSIMMDKGIKNAVTVVEKLNNPHIEDDFHRFLVQYLVSVGIPDLKPETPLAKALKMRLFEITLPDSAYEDKTYKDLIAAMEQLYLGLQSIGDGRNNEGKDYFMFEIGLSNSTDEIVFYAAIPTLKGDMFEKQLLSFYHDAKVREVPDDYNIFIENGAAAASYASLKDKAMFPLRTYDSFDHDPMSTILNVFAKLKQQGEGAAVQFIIAPAGDTYIKKFSSVLHALRKGESLKNATSKISSFGSQFGREAKNFFLNPLSKEKQDKENNEESKKVDEEVPSRIAEKIKSTIMTAGIRVVAAAESKDRADQILSELESAFNQFENPGSNSIEFKHVNERGLPELLHNFSFRLMSDDEMMPLNIKELTTIFHLPFGITGAPQLREAKAGIAPAPVEMASVKEGIIIGTNSYRGRDTEIRMTREDRLRHFYVIGQTGAGKTVSLKNMIRQDILNGDGCCYIDPHGTDIQDILSFIPPERIDDVIYFDPAYTARPMGLNMLEYDERFPEQKSFVVGELMGIFNKLYDMKTVAGPAFEQYFRNAAFLVMEHPESGSTLVEISRVMSDKAFRDLKLSHCKNPMILEFWRGAEKTTGDQSLANFVPYITRFLDVFFTNEIMRPVISQQKSVFNFREIMDNKKILLVNLAKGRLGEINAKFIGLIVVGKIQMAALSRVDMYGQKMNDFYLYIDEFQNVTTDSISSILSEARKYHLSLNLAHQYIAQLDEGIKNAVFGNVGSMEIMRVSSEDANFLEARVAPAFKASDLMKLDNLNAYMSMIVNGQPVKAFNVHIPFPPRGNVEIVEQLKELSYLKFGRPREEVEDEIMDRYKKKEVLPPVNVSSA